MFMIVRGKQRAFLRTDHEAARDPRYAGTALGSYYTLFNRIV